MKLIERLALVKAGYTKKEIAQIEADELQQAQQEPEPEPEKVNEDPAPEPEADTEEDDIDYKQLYEDTKKQLADAQKLNVTLAGAANNIQSDDDLTAWEKTITDAL